MTSEVSRELVTKVGGWHLKGSPRRKIKYIRGENCNSAVTVALRNSGLGVREPRGRGTSTVESS
jgi:hypothetical protein